MRIAVLITAFNRADTTVAGLSRLAALTSDLSDEFEFNIFLVDDGSTDGTSSRVRDLPLAITITQGTGSLFWNRGMVLAYRTALASDGPFDAYMLYNDDILLNEGFRDFVRRFRALKDSILVGAFSEPDSGTISYSGFVRVGKLRPFAYVQPTLSEPLVPIDTFNGNLVLIPAWVFEKLGGLDPFYTHAYGDIDLGLRAKAIGVNSFLYGTTVGSCARGPSLDERIRAATLRNRWNLLFGHPHGPSSHLRFARKHGVRALFPFYAVAETARRMFKLVWPPTKIR